MNKKNFMDMMICSLSAAIIILCFTYMEQSRGRDTLMAVCGIVFLAFLLLAVTDSLSGRQKKRGNGRGIQELLLLDEEGNEISAWHPGFLRRFCFLNLQYTTAPPHNLTRRADGLPFRHTLYSED